VYDKGKQQMQPTHTEYQRLIGGVLTIVLPGLFGDMEALARVSMVEAERLDGIQRPLGEGGEAGSSGAETKEACQVYVG